VEPEASPAKNFCSFIFQFQFSVIYHCWSSRQRCRLVTASDLRSAGVAGFESRSRPWLAGVVLGCPEFKSSATFVNNLLGCLLPVGVVIDYEQSLFFLSPWAKRGSPRFSRLKASPLDARVHARVLSSLFMWSKRETARSFNRVFNPVMLYVNYLFLILVQCL